MPSQINTALPDSDDLQVVDDTDRDDTIPLVQYDITSYGADFDTEGLVNRLRRGDIYIPPFQRNFVWTQKEASRFIESLLLGLPVPGIFLAKEKTSKKMIVIDGQQRLRTLQLFFDGHFNPSEESKTERIFELVGVQKQFEGKTYATLDDDSKIVLNDSVVHATVVKQDSPDDNQSLYLSYIRAVEQ